MPWRWALGVAVVAVLASATTAQWRAEAGGRAPTVADLGRVRDLAAVATVEVSALGCSGLSIGSGFGVDGVVVTNRHLVHDVVEAKVQRGRELFRVPVTALHPTLDLAVLAGVGGPDLQLAPRRPAVGEPVVLAGRPGIGAVEVRASTVHLYSDGEVWGMAGPVMLLDTATAPGWSGGPVLDGDGRVVGVLAAVDHATGLAIAVPAPELRRFLRGAAADEAPVPTC